ncbi:hypothetical protein [Motiliproteus sp. MSK22-1]|uniref:hypothetical protein n=1 Tax=Motiliproteus sp. MSK22-1 TaxID=1897630 RepID=UPI00130167AE|nr:hypothetical protein [Motiliproteus sp. MSK22-1]
MTENRPDRQRRNWRENFARLLRLRLIIPLLREKHPPEYIARGLLLVRKKPLQSK